MGRPRLELGTSGLKVRCATIAPAARVTLCHCRHNCSGNKPKIPKQYQGRFHHFICIHFILPPLLQVFEHYILPRQKSQGFILTNYRFIRVVHHKDAYLQPPSLRTLHSHRAVSQGPPSFSGKSFLSR